MAALAGAGAALTGAGAGAGAVFLGASFLGASFLDASFLGASTGLSEAFEAFLTFFSSSLLLEAQVSCSFLYS